VTLPSPEADGETNEAPQAGHWPEARVAVPQAAQTLIRLRSIRQAIQPTPARRTGNRRTSRVSPPRKLSS